MGPGKPGVPVPGIAELGFFNLCWTCLKQAVDLFQTALVTTVKTCETKVFGVSLEIASGSPCWDSMENRNMFKDHREQPHDSWFLPSSTITHPSPHPPTVVSAPRTIR